MTHWEENLRGEIDVRLVRLDLWWVFWVGALCSREQCIAVLEGVRHKSADCTEVRVTNLKAENELREGSSGREHKLGHCD